MKIYKHLLVILFLISCFAANAQNPYYWTNEGKVFLTENAQQLIIHTKSSEVLEGVAAKETFNGLASVDAFPNKKFAVVKKDNSGLSKQQIFDRLNLSSQQILDASPAYQLSDGFTMFPTHQVVFKPLDDVYMPQMSLILGNYNYNSVYEKYGVYRVDLKDVKDAFNLANELYETGFTAFAQPDFYAPKEHYADPLFDQQFQMNNTGQTIDGVSGVNDMDCNALEAWGISLGSSSITVAVIDDGVENHEDLNDSAGNSRFINGFSPANNGNGTPNSSGQHGLACAGIIAASHNNIGVQGVAPLVKLLSVNIFVGGESAQDIADGITWAKNQGADVMSNSWGYTSCSANFASINNAISDATSTGRGGKGCVIVFASGNGSKSCVDYPGKNANVIAVGAFTNQGNRSSYSNYGSDLDIMAPSNAVGAQPGAGVRTTDRMGSSGYSSGNYTNTFGGTSAACPVVSGVSALVLAANPDLTHTQVKNILYSTAIDMGASGVDVQYANGRVNAFAAVQAAENETPTCTDGIQNGDETGVDCGGSCPPCDTSPTYCGSNGNNTNDEFISNVTLGSINNNSGAGAGGYTDFTANSTVLTKGESNTISVTPTWTGTLYNEGYSVWIDYNQDGDFTDAGEQVWSQSPTQTTPVSGNFTVPATATDGTTRMRVSLKYNGVPTSCESFQYGEVEDYSVDIQPAVADTQAPTDPTGLAASNITQTTLTLSWTAATDNVAVTGYDVYQGNTVIGNTAGTTFNVTGLSASTAYSFRVKAKDAAGNESGFSNTANATTLDVVITYCDSKGNNQNFEFIDNVSIGNISNATGADGGYGDFTALIGNVAYGANTIVVSAGFVNSAYTEFWRVWIDYNQNGTFEANEEAVAGSSSSAGNLSYNFTIPASALGGNTRMRVSMQYNAAPTACQTFTYGEVEDYTLNIGGATSFTTDPLAIDGELGHETPIFDMNLYPNPVVGDELYLNLADRRTAQFYIYDFSGQLIQSGEVSQKAIKVGNLPAGVYMVQIDDYGRKITAKFIKQ